MSVDTATYVNQFDVAKPTGSDPKSEGDDNFRHMKTVLKTTFPNVAGAVTPSHTVLNYMLGVTSAVQTQLDAKAALASPTFTGDPKAPTPSPGDNDTSIATTAFVVANFANLASPTFTGTPSAPTALAGTSTTQLATTAFVTATSFASSLPGQTGNSGKFLTTDGTNSSWSSNIPSPTLTGTPIAPTPTVGATTTQIATAEFVDLSFAKKASPTLTGTPIAPTAAAGTNTTQIATTEFVTRAIGAYTADAVGTYMFCRAPGSGGVGVGNTIAGSSLTPGEVTPTPSVSSSGSVLSGTWRAMGHSNSGNGVTLYLRIA